MQPGLVRLLIDEGLIQQVLRQESRCTFLLGGHDVRVDCSSLAVGRWKYRKQIKGSRDSMITVLDDYCGVDDPIRGVSA